MAKKKLRDWILAAFLGSLRSLPPRTEAKRGEENQISQLTKTSKGARTFKGYQADNAVAKPRLGGGLMSTNKC